MKIICIGRNYSEHIKELNNKQTEYPVFFLKPDTALIQKHMPFFIPPFSKLIHYEVEIVLKICKVGKHIQTKFAHTYYDSIGLGIDFTARDIQNQCKKLGLPWEAAKAFDFSAPVSQFFLKSKFQDINSLSFSLKKNDEIVQNGNTSEMIFSFDEIIAHVSKYITLKTGDYIFTGTPSGVGQVLPNDILTGFIEDKQVLQVKIK